MLPFYESERFFYFRSEGGGLFAVQGPETSLAYALCTAEHFTGVMMSSLLLGIVFAKASIPTAKTAFSKVCLITTRCASLLD